MIPPYPPELQVARDQRQYLRGKPGRLALFRRRELRPPLADTMWGYYFPESPSYLSLYNHQDGRWIVYFRDAFTELPQAAPSASPEPDPWGPI